MKIEIVSFLKDQTEIENFEIDPALIHSKKSQLGRPSLYFGQYVIIDICSIGVPQKSLPA